MKAHPIKVTINEDTAEIRFLVSHDAQGFILANATVKRASHVEPCDTLIRLWFHLIRAVFGEVGPIADWTRHWDCNWQVNLTPVNGPIVSYFLSRKNAIAYEVQWLEANFL